SCVSWWPLFFSVAEAGEVGEKKKKAGCPVRRTASPVRAHVRPCGRSRSSVSPSVATGRRNELRSLEPRASPRLQVLPAPLARKVAPPLDPHQSLVAYRGPSLARVGAGRILKSGPSALAGAQRGPDKCVYPRRKINVRERNEGCCCCRDGRGLPR